MVWSSTLHFCGWSSCSTVGVYFCAWSCDGVECCFAVVRSVAFGHFGRLSSRRSAKALCLVKVWRDLSFQMRRHCEGISDEYGAVLQIGRIWDVRSFKPLLVVSFAAFFSRMLRTIWSRVRNVGANHHMRKPTWYLRRIHLRPTLLIKKKKRHTRIGIWSQGLHRNSYMSLRWSSKRLCACLVKWHALFSRPSMSNPFYGWQFRL